MKLFSMDFINENIAFAKSILQKLGIENDSDLWNDYLKIRDICGHNNGYVGILTKIRFIDKIEDMDEIKSIFDVLKNSKIDINKLNKLSYDEILGMFYDELSIKTDSSDFELIYKDSVYSYYKVYTYKGILEIGSPSWCLKTKSKWIEYQKAWPEQWVVINNEYKKVLISPNSMYLDSYKSSKSWIRYGVSYDPKKNTFEAYTDVNGRVDGHISKWNSFGVLYTIKNLSNGIKKSYFDYFDGCQKIGENDKYNILKITNIDLVKKIVDVNVDNFSEYYIFLSRTYEHKVIFICISDEIIGSIIATNEESKPVGISIEGYFFKKIILEYALKSNSMCFIGIKLNLGLVTMDEVLKNKSFLMEVGNWLVFDRDDYYLVVNKNLKDFDLPNVTFKNTNYSMDNPLFWYIDKKTMNPLNSRVEHEYQKLVINSLPKNDKGGKIKGFWNFFKRK